MLLILGVDYALPLAVVVFVLDLLPLVGATLGAIIVGLVTLFSDFPVDTLIWTAWAIVYQQVENNVIQPRIQSRAVQLDPLIVLVAVLFGSTLAGVLGALLAIPVAASIQITVHEFVALRRTLEQPPPATPAVRIRRDGLMLGVLGVPTSAGAFAPGQERAPAALRAAGLLEALRAAGLEVHDHGDREEWRWRPDRGHPRAQHVGRVVEIVRDTAARVAAAAEAGEVTLVLGGDCTVGIGTVAGWVGRDERVGLLYLDAHADLNVPASVPEGALDWMGMAHMLAEPDALPELAAAFPHTPLLDPANVVLVGWDPGQATRLRARGDRAARHLAGAGGRGEREPGGCGRAGGRAAGRPLRPRARALRRRRHRLHGHAAVGEHRAQPGAPYDAAMRALAGLLAAPGLAGLTITELNPFHVESEPVLTSFAGAVARALSRKPG